MRQRLHVAYDVVKRTYALRNDDRLTAAQMIRKAKQYPADAVVTFSSTPYRMQLRVMRAVRHRW